jgi:hypothetical protein
LTAQQALHACGMPCAADGCATDNEAGTYAQDSADCACDMRAWPGTAPLAEAPPAATPPDGPGQGGHIRGDADLTVCRGSLAPSKSETNYSGVRGPPNVGACVLGSHRGTGLRSEHVADSERKVASHGPPAPPGTAAACRSGTRPRGPGHGGTRSTSQTVRAPPLSSLCLEGHSKPLHAPADTMQAAPSSTRRTRSSEPSRR